MSATITVREATAEQQAVFTLTIRLWATTDATIVSKLEPTGDMLLVIIWQGRTDIARIDPQGRFVGEWF